MAKEEWRGIKNSRGLLFYMNRPIPSFKLHYAALQSSATKGGDAEYAIVNENYDVIMHAYGRKSQVIFHRNDNIAILAYNLEPEGNREDYILNHYHVMGLKPILINSFSRAHQIGKTLFKVQTSSGMIALYDMATIRIISDEFTRIAEFKNYEGIKGRIAVATLDIPYPGNPKEICEVSCLIYENGRIRGPIYNSHDDTLIYITEAEFDFKVLIAEIKRKMAIRNPSQNNNVVKLIHSLNYSQYFLDNTNDIE